MRPWILPLVIALLVGSVGWWAQSTVEGAVKQQLAAEFSTLVDAEVAALSMWLDIEKSEAQKLAINPVVHAHVLGLIQRSANQSGEWEALRSSREMVAFRAELDRLIPRPTILGYGVIDPTGRIIAAKSDAAVGRRIRASVAESFDRVLEGRTAVIGPLMYPVSEIGQDSLVMQPAIFVATPVIDTAGEVLAAFVLRFSPKDDFSAILHLARPGESGETYAFNDDGVMITESRFSDQLIALGLLAEGADTTSVFAVDILQFIIMNINVR